MFCHIFIIVISRYVRPERVSKLRIQASESSNGGSEATNECNQGDRNGWAMCEWRQVKGKALRWRRCNGVPSLTCLSPNVQILKRQNTTEAGLQ